MTQIGDKKFKIQNYVFGFVFNSNKLLKNIRQKPFQFLYLHPEQAFGILV